jgi:hypothetical protein
MGIVEEIAGFVTIIRYLLHPEARCAFAKAEGVSVTDLRFLDDSPEVELIDQLGGS